MLEDAFLRSRRRNDHNFELQNPSGGSGLQWVGGYLLKPLGTTQIQTHYNKYIHTKWKTDKDEIMLHVAACCAAIFWAAQDQLLCVSHVWQIVSETFRFISNTRKVHAE